MKRMMKLGWPAAFVLAAVLLFAGCPTDSNGEPPLGDGEITIFGNGAFLPGAELVAHADAGLHAALAGGNIAVQWNPADYGGSGALRANVDLDPPLDISGFTDLLVEWAVPATYSANMTIVLGFDDDEILMMFKHAQPSDLFNFRGGRNTDIWVGSFTGTSQRLSSVEVFSPDAVNFGGGTTLNISRIAVVGGDAPANGGGDDNDNNNAELPPEETFNTTINIDGTQVAASVTSRFARLVGGNIVVQAAPDGNTAVVANLNEPLDISGVSNFAMTWSASSDWGATFNVFLSFTEEGRVALHHGWVGQYGGETGTAVFNFVSEWQNWDDAFADTTLMLTGFEIFSGNAGTLTISQISFQ